MEEIRSVVRLHKKFIKNTEKECIVTELTIHLSNLTKAVQTACGFLSIKVYITTRMLKHIYDKRAAEEYDFIIRNIQNIVKFPDQIYENKGGKRGNFCFVKVISGKKYFCSIEETQDGLFLATCFRLSKESYLNNYKLIWSWKGDNSSS